MKSKLTKKNSSPLDNQLINGIEPDILNSIRDPLGVFGIDFSVKWVNKAMAYLHQSKPEDMIGKNCYFDFCKKSVSCGECPVICVRDSGKMSVTERWMEFPDGIKRWGKIRGYPVRDSNRELLAVLVLVIETTNIQSELHEKKEYIKYLLNIVNSIIGKNKANIVRTNDKLQINISDREIEVLRLLTEGYTNIKISTMLSISNNTVKRHVDNIFNKLGVNDRTQAAVLAVRNKLI
jgi:DNA-binding CsgD family transcriptional regulator